MLGRLFSRKFSQALKPPVNVSVTGGSGNIAYSMLFRIASGGLFGPDQPINLRVHDLPFMQDKLKGVVMELHDCAFPLLNDLVATDVDEAIYRDSQFVFLVGSKPRGPGMERKDLLQQNGEIFTAVGESIGKYADRNCRVLVIGNPANTNALICANNAEGIPQENFTAMTRLDHNRAMIQLANRTGKTVNDVKQLTIWGNHSSTMYPDITSCTIGGAPAAGQLEDAWVKNEFLQTVQQRGAAIIAARGASSAASAGSAGLDHMRDWVQGTNGEWVSMAVPSDQFNGEYGIPAGLMFSYPMTCANGKYELVRGLNLDDYSKEMIKITTEELLEERATVEHLLK